MASSLSTQSLAAGLALNNLVDQIQAGLKNGTITPAQAQQEMQQAEQQYGGGSTTQPTTQPTTCPASQVNSSLTNALGPQVPNN